MSVVMLLLVVSFAALLLRGSSSALAGWFNDNWLYRTQHTINNAGSAVTDRKVKLDIDTATLISDGKMQADCGDSRFTDPSGKILEYEIGEYTATTSTVSYVENTTYTDTTSSNSDSFSHTVTAGTDTVLIVIYNGMRYQTGSTPIDVNSATYNGVSMTKAIEVDHYTTNRNYVTSIWYLVNPSTGSNTVTTNYNVNVQNSSLSAITISGVDQDNPLGGTASNNGSTSPLTAAVLTTVADSMIVGGGGNRGDWGTLSVDTGTQLYSHNVRDTGNTGSNGAGGYLAAPTVGTNNFTISATTNVNTVAAVELVPSTSESTTGDLCNNASTDFYVVLPEVLAGANTVYHYYGNPYVANGFSVGLSQTEFVPGSTSTLSEENSPGPVARWKMNEGYGSKVHDSGGQRLDLVRAPALASTNTVTATTSTNNGYGGEEASFMDQVFYDSIHDRWHVTYIDNSGNVSTMSSAGDDGENWTAGVALTSIGQSYEYYDCVLDETDTNSYMHCVYSDSGTDHGYYNRCEFTGISPYITCGTEQKYWDASDQDGETIDDISHPSIDIDSERCILLGFIFEDDSKTDADEYEVWFMKEDATCGDGTWNYDAATYPMKSVQAEAGYNAHPPLNIKSFGDLDAQLTYMDTDVAGTFELETIFFDGDTETFGTQRTMDTDIEGKATRHNVDSVVFGTTNLTVGMDDGTTDIDAWYITTKDGSTVNQVDTTIDTTTPVDNVTLGTIAAVVDTEAPGGDDVWVFAQDANSDDIVYNVSTDGGATWGTETLFVDSYDSGGITHLAAFFAEETCDILLRWEGETASPWNINTKVVNTGSCSASSTPPSWKTGQDVDNAQASLEFDGTDDYLSHADTPLLDVGTSSFTISGRFRHTASVTGTDVLLAKYNEAGYKVYMNSSGYLCVGIDDDSTWGPDDSACSGATQGSYADSQWHHFYAVKNGTTSLTLYVDGAEVASDTSIVATGTLNNSDPLYIGVDSDESSNYWEGELSDVAIYPYARSTAEVLLDYSGQASVLGYSVNFGSTGIANSLSDGLVGYWPMDEAVANTCAGGTNDTCDKSGNGNDGSWIGDASDASGKYGRGVTLDGTGDYIDMGDTTDTDIQFPFSMATWVNINQLPSLDEAYSIFTKYGNSGSRQYVWQIETDDNLIFWKSHNGTNGAYSTAVIPFDSNDIGEWVHVAITGEVKGDQVIIRMFRNGEMVAEDDSSITDTSIYAGANVNFQLGGRANNVHRLNGDLDDARMYNRALSPNEVRDLYNWAPGPKIYWNLDEKVEGDGGVIKDASGNGINLVTSNGANDSGMDCTVHGKYGSGCQLDGIDDEATRTDEGELDLGTNTNFSVALWVKHDGGDDQNYLRTLSPGNDGRLSFEYKNSVSALRFFIADNSGNFCTVDGSSDIDDGAWHHVVATVKRSASCTTAEMELFVDGVPEQTTISAATLSSNININTSTYSMSYSGNPVQGFIDEFQIFEYALTPKQVTNIMNARSPGQNSVGSPIGSPIGYWKFDGGYGETAQDSSANDNDGDLTGTNPSCATNTCPAWTTDGKFGSALVFDGSNDYVEVGDPASGIFDFGTGDFAVSTWFKTTDTGFQVLVSKTSSGGNNGWELRQQSGSGSQMNFIIDDTLYILGTTVIANDGEWHHALGQRKGDYLYLYIDGKLAGAPVSGASSYNVSGTESLYIGARESTFSGSVWNGTLDEVQIFDYGFTPEEVKILYNQGKTAVFGSTSTASDGVTSDWSAARQYCIPGDTATCTPPVVHFTFDENTGTGDDAVKDVSGTEANGDFDASMTNANWVPGVKGSALYFDGSDDELNIDSEFHSGEFTTGTEDEVTVSMWVKFNDVPSVQGDAALLAGFPGASSDHGWRLTTSVSTDRFLFDVTDGTSKQEVSSDTVASNDWHHVVGRYDVNGYLSIFVDGVREQHDLSTVNNLMQDEDMWIGSLAGNFDWMDGAVDDFRLYDYARTDAQILWDYNQGAPIAHWKMDECQGTDIYDSSVDANGDSNGYHGTLTIGATGSNTSVGTCDSGTGTESWNNGTTGYLNSAVSFDGTNDYVALPSNSTEWLPKNDHTVTAWIKGDSWANSPMIFDGNHSASSIDVRDAGFRMRIMTSGYVNTGIKTVDATTEYVWYGGGGTALSLGQWYHLAQVRDGAEYKLYVNGKLTNTYTIDASEVDYDGDAYDDEAVNIGRFTRLLTTPDQYFDGLIDDVQLYNYPLTDKQIEVLYAQGAVSFQ